MIVANYKRGLLANYQFTDNSQFKVIFYRTTGRVPIPKVLTWNMMSKTYFMKPSFFYPVQEFPTTMLGLFLSVFLHGPRTFTRPTLTLTLFVLWLSSLGLSTWSLLHFLFCFEGPGFARWSGSGPLSTASSSPSPPSSSTWSPPPSSSRPPKFDPSWSRRRPSKGRSWRSSTSCPSQTSRRRRRCWRRRKSSTRPPSRRSFRPRSVRPFPRFASWRRLTRRRRRSPEISTQRRWRGKSRRHNKSPTAEKSSNSSLN